MSDLAPPAAPGAALAHLRSLPLFQVDPDLREWGAPTGILASEPGVTASFRAIGMRSVVGRAEDGSLSFEAWRTPRLAGAALAALLGGGLYLGLAAGGVTNLWILAAVVAAAFYVPIAVLPSYRVSGRISAGRVQLRLQARGLFGRRDTLERRLRFYLER